MRSNKHLLLTLVLLIVVAALYRIIPDRPMGFAPQWAMALFAGAVIKDRKRAFLFPVLSMFVSDMIYHFLFVNGWSTMPGFYEGQITNYLLFAGLTAIGFLMKKLTVVNILFYSLVICAVFFVLSNFFVWQSDASFHRPQTFGGLLQCYADGLPFLRNSIISTLVFSGVLFGGWKLIHSAFKPIVNQ